MTNANSTSARSATNSITKEIVLRAPKARVWRAIADAGEFGTWFGVKLEGSFKVGSTLSGRITVTGYEHLTMEMTVERMEPEDFFSYRWHPNATNPATDYSSEPTTLVEFRLEEVVGGTKLTLLESGFDEIPAGRRAEAFRQNDKGWTGQLEQIRRYVEG